MWEKKLFHNSVFFSFFLKRYRQLETHAWWKSYPVSFGGGKKGKPQRVRQQGGNIPRAHSTCHLTPPPLFRHPLPPLHGSFFFGSRNRTHELGATVKLCHLANFTRRETTHTWCWRRRWWSGAFRPWPRSRRRTQSCRHPAAGRQRWTWGCCPPGSGARCSPGCGRRGASCMTRRLGRWPRSAAWRCARAGHPGTWAPWWTGWRRPQQTELVG